MKDQDPSAPGTAPHRGIRVAAITALTVGILSVGAGVSLGAAALVDTDSAATRQYETSTTTLPTTTTTVPGPPTTDDGGTQNPGGGGGGGGGGDKPGGGQPLGADASGQQGEPVPDAAPQRAAASTDGSLAFTGYFLIPLLAVGLALAAGGFLVLRRQSASDTEALA
jgi:hypothetical protein